MEKVIMHCLYIWTLPKVKLYFGEKQLPKKVVKILGQLWSTIYAWVMLPSDRRSRVSFLTIPAMISENCQSHHVCIMGRNSKCNRNKKRK